MEILKRMGAIGYVSPLAISTILDPRFKKIHFEDLLACANAVCIIKDLIKKISKEKRCNCRNTVIFKLAVFTISQMAGNRINTKTKGKDEKTKVNKSANQAQEESEDLDYTVLRKPILTSITGFAQARKIFDLATEELKNLLSTECDLLYECKVCRNLFRSLANFISHKRVYCKENFNSSIHSHFIKPPSTENEIFKIKRLEEEYQESLKEKDSSECVDKEVSDDRIPLTKDLTAIIEKLARNRGIKEAAKEDCEILLQDIPKTSVAVFQNVNYNKDTNCDIRSQVKELDSMLSRNKAILQSDGRFKILNSIGINKSASEQDNVIQISDDDENGDNNVLKCKICELQFSTQKTLRFHMKYKHLESRLVYPCPDCLEIFSTSWSVYRHLFKVHRKTAAQIRRLRESIQAKAFRMNNPPAFYEKRKNNMKPSTPPKISEEERLDQENQAWMDNMEGDGELPRCGGCGRTFERRAALAAHTHTCQPRSRALARRADTKKIEIQIRKDYNKGPPPAINDIVKTTDANANKLVAEYVSPLPKAINESQKEDEKNSEPLLNSDTYTIPTANENVNTENKILYNNVENFVPKLPFAQQAEKSNLAALKVRIQRDTDLDELVCRKCDVKHDELQDLYDHMAGHYNWIRYACKLCNFKHYNFEKLPEHVKVVHKLRGDSDFFCTTIKAVDGPEALELCEQADDGNENSPDSRRPSRCSSDSSRLSDDSSSSSTRVEVGAKKRKMNTRITMAKKKKEAVVNDENEDQKCNEVYKDNINENEVPSNAKVFEENSSDMDEIDDKVAKKHIIEETKSTSNRRPVRKRTRPKNEDFEYDLSNLLKMEAQGYRDSQSVTNTKSNQSKKKVPVEIQNTYEIANKDCCGALATLSKKAVENSVAHMKVLSFCEAVAPKEQRATNIFVRPLLPKVFRADKTSPRKEVSDDIKETINSNKKPTESQISPNKNSQTDETLPDISPKPNEDAPKTVLIEDKNKQKPADTTCETVKANVNIPAVVPIKFRRQSLEVMKNPLINKNITDLSKAGMKTKILVIKPIKSNRDGTQTIKTPLKFQTIKLKDPNRGNSSSDEKPSDHVVVVQVPKVDCSKAHHSPKICNTNDAEKIDNSKRDLMDDSGNKKLSEKNNEMPVEINNISSTGECNNVTESVLRNPECIDYDKVPSVDTESSVN
ncbi:unnamed protein product [Parnassius apollo]|uniref:(apollo) hypothetical protein n=1 Tax=Parnassius apollo TaxID=110799 RepID=A0A8S3WZM4_PARAO|nr:unnamed protein product [Parnassius apollo]